MSRIAEWMDLVEFNSLTALFEAGWSEPASPCTIESVGQFQDVEGNGGLYVLQMGTNVAMNSPILSAGVAEFYHRIHFKVTTNFNASVPIVTYKSGATNMIMVVPNGDGTISLWIGGVLAATSTNILVLGTYYTIEIGVTIGAAGTYEVRVDGTSVGWIPSPGAVDTQPGAETTVDRFMLATTVGGRTYWYDDMAADDADWCGDGIITFLHPTAEGTTIELTPSTGTDNSANVDEIPPDNVDYNEATAVDKMDTYVAGNLPASAFTVKSVAVVSRVARVGTGIATGYAVVRSGGADHEHPDSIPLPASHGIAVRVFDEDPNGPTPWTVAAANALEFGIRFDA